MDWNEIWDSLDEHDRQLIIRARKTRWEDIQFAESAHSSDAKKEIIQIKKRKELKENDLWER